MVTVWQWSWQFLAVGITTPQNSLYLHHGGKKSSFKRENTSGVWVYRPGHTYSYWKFSAVFDRTGSIFKETLCFNFLYCNVLPAFRKDWGQGQETSHLQIYQGQLFLRLLRIEIHLLLISSNAWSYDSAFQEKVSPLLVWNLAGLLPVNTFLMIDPSTINIKKYHQRWE